MNKTPLTLQHIGALILFIGVALAVFGATFFWIGVAFPKASAPQTTTLNCLDGTKGLVITGTSVDEQDINKACHSLWPNLKAASDRACPDGWYIDIPRKTSTSTPQIECNLLANTIISW